MLRAKGQKDNPLNPRSRRQLTAQEKSKQQERVKATKEKNNRDKEKEARKNCPASSFFSKQSLASKGDAIAEMMAAFIRDERGAAASREGGRLLK